MSLGDLIKTAREAKSLTQKELSARLGVSLASVRKYELAGEKYGQYPPFQVLAKIAVTLEIDPRLVLAEGLENKEEKIKIIGRHISSINKMMDLEEQIEIAMERLDDALAEVREYISSDKEVLLRDMDLFTGMNFDTSRFAVEDFRRKSALKLKNEKQNGPNQNSLDRPVDARNQEAVGAASATHEEEN